MTVQGLIAALKRLGPQAQELEVIDDPPIDGAQVIEADDQGREYKVPYVVLQAPLQELLVHGDSIAKAFLPYVPESDGPPSKGSRKKKRSYTKRNTKFWAKAKKARGAR